MMFDWNVEKIRFFRDAAEFTPFHENLAAQILPCLTGKDTICDAGCGLGYLSLALAPHCGKVTAVDISAEALRALRENKAGLRNVEVWECDVFRLGADILFDVMIFCFFGKLAELLSCAKAHCIEKVILVKRAGAFRRFSVKEVPREKDTFAEACAALDALGIPYRCNVFPLESGQPFRSVADAQAFFKLYSGDAVSETDIRTQLVRTQSAKFPYYLSVGQETGIIVIDTKDIPDSIYDNGALI
ncbi:MAG: class I SAM-dependent methyltransferase [Clostridiales bacterium]|nr:class I SAM-dependent methyltransferase [Clostridiales bacterium]